MPLRLVLKLLQHRSDLGAGLGVGADKVGQHDADVAQLLLGHGLEQVREGRGGDLCQIGVADADRFGVVEIRRKLVEQDQQRLQSLR